MGNFTPLIQWHRDQGAKIVTFGGWEMPVNYGSQIEEHVAVRSRCGIFDVSHMAIVDIDGDQSKSFLQYVLANDVNKLTKTGSALYSCMLNEEGGILDDLIVYWKEGDFYRLVVNASMAEQDLAWLNQQAQNFQVDIRPRRDLAMVAVQGPKAADIVSAAAPTIASLAHDLKVFSGGCASDFFVARTGYTGEDGFEVMLPASNAVEFCDSLIAQGATPCGLGARDTLRIEAGLNLYGQDMDDSIKPTECGLSWTVAMRDDREFIGKAALKEPPRFDQMGIILLDRGVLRAHQKIDVAGGKGEITSGTFSPTLKQSIGFARVPVGTVEGDCHVNIRGKQLACRLVPLPFVRRGKVLVQAA